MYQLVCMRACVRYIDTAAALKQLPPLVFLDHTRSVAISRQFGWTGWDGCGSIFHVFLLLDLFIFPYSTTRFGDRFAMGLMYKHTCMEAKYRSINQRRIQCAADLPLLACHSLWTEM